MARVGSYFTTSYQKDLKTSKKLTFWAVSWNVHAGDQRMMTGVIISILNFIMQNEILFFEKNVPSSWKSISGPKGLVSALSNPELSVGRGNTTSTECMDQMSNHITWHWVTNNLVFLVGKTKSPLNRTSPTLSQYSNSQRRVRVIFLKAGAQFQV